MIGEKNEKRTCFIVTPIGNEGSEIRRHIEGIIDQAIYPAIGDAFDIKVAHREYKTGSINDRVIKSVYDSDLVIANLTGLNPNVMFELAIRYSFGKPVIVIAEEGTKLPFDIIDENTIFYINDPSGAADLKDKIAKFVGEIDCEKNTYGPVYSTLKNAAAFEQIESGFDNKDIDRNAFLYLADKIDSLENMLKKTNTVKETPTYYTWTTVTGKKGIEEKMERLESQLSIYENANIPMSNETAECVLDELSQAKIDVSEVADVSRRNMYYHKISELKKRVCDLEHLE